MGCSIRAQQIVGGELLIFVFIESNLDLNLNRYKRWKARCNKYSKMIKPVQVVVMNNGWSCKLIIIFVLLFVLTGCGGSISYHPPYTPIYVSVDTNGNVSIGVSRTIATNFGTFQIGTSAEQEIQRLRQSENFKDKRLLIVRVDYEVTTFELTEGEEFRIEFQNDNGGYRKVSLTYEPDGDIVLEAMSAGMMDLISDENKRKIAFMSDRDGNLEIYTMDIDGTNLFRLTYNEAGDGLPAWSPNGERIVFRSFRDNNQEIYIMDADGTNLTRLTNNETRDDFPTWSIHNVIAFESSEYFSYHGICTITVEGKDLRCLTDDDYYIATAPVWSQDGTQIAFASNADGDYEIYIMTGDGTNITRVTDNNVDDMYPSWSPDGKKIVFSSTYDDNSDIFVKALSSPDTVRLTTNPADDTLPSWSPDGKYIAFQSKRDDNWEIYVIRADGTNLTRLTHNEVADVSPAWSP
jgi:Tol biopolymer transport system component